MDTQEIFDRIVERSKNPVQSMTDWGYCLYRDRTGKTPPCFVGVLIKDEFYNPKMEGDGVRLERTRTAVERSIGRDLNVAEICLLSACQDVHDLCDPDKWEYELKVIAWKYGLKYR